MYVEKSDYCRVCGDEKLVDVNRGGNETMQAYGLSLHSVAPDDIVIRCYCPSCGLLYHPGSVDVGHPTN